MVCAKTRKKLIFRYGNNHDDFVSLLRQKKKHYFGHEEKPPRSGLVVYILKSGMCKNTFD
jgi:hypothetical protein